MGAFSKGDIVLFPFPFTDLSDRKIRPCLVLSEEMNQDILLCQITSKKIHRDAYSVELQEGETLDGSLRIDSYIRTNMIFTAEKSQILKKLCRVKQEKYRKIVSVIIKLIS